MRKTSQLQIRVSPAEKAQLKRLARAAGMDVSTYVLSRSLTDSSARVTRALRSLAAGNNSKLALAEFSDALAELSADELEALSDRISVEGLSHFLQNYVAALTEQAFVKAGLPLPEWTRDVSPLDSPWFATTMRSLRMHLLRSSPVVFKRRNLFVDPGAGRV